MCASRMSPSSCQMWVCESGSSAGATGAIAALIVGPMSAVLYMDRGMRASMDSGVDDLEAKEADESERGESSLGEAR